MEDKYNDNQGTFFNKEDEQEANKTTPEFNFHKSAQENKSESETGGTAAGDTEVKQKQQKETKLSTAKKTNNHPAEGLSTEDIKAAFPKQEVTTNPDRSLSIRYKNGKGLRIIKT